MQRRHAIFIADSLDNARVFRQVLADLDIEVSPGSSMQFRRLLQAKPGCDLLIYEFGPQTIDEVVQVEAELQTNAGVPLLAIVGQAQLPDYRPPRLVPNDFVVSGASAAECALRIQGLLWPEKESAAGDMVSVDGMTVNLATYQVQVNGAPIDLTYLEYALLAFLVTHSGRTYSRDALLRRVWGFDYYGGSRTVDVHVRRVRAKLGPELAQHLVTVRGVGYLWE